MGPLAAILSFEGGVALQEVSECPDAARLVLNEVAWEIEVYLYKTISFIFFSILFFFFLSHLHFRDNFIFGVIRIVFIFEMVFIFWSISFFCCLNFCVVLIFGLVFILGVNFTFVGAY